MRKQVTAHLMTGNFKYAGELLQLSNGVLDFVPLESRPECATDSAKNQSNINGDAQTHSTPMMLVLPYLAMTSTSCRKVAAPILLAKGTSPAATP